MSDNFILDSQERKYFTMLPNVVDDLGLSVYAFRLYCHIRRVTGEDGKCWQSTETLAKSCRMSVHAVVDSKKELAAANLVTITTAKRPGGGRAYHIITIQDIWELNLKHCTKQVTTGNLLVTTGNLQVTDMQLKNNPPLKEEAHKNITGRGKRVSLAQAGEKSPPPASDSGAASIFPPIPRNHPAIRAIKEVTGYYPHKSLYKRIADLLGETPDIERMRLTFETWTAGGRNPQNVKGWLFDWFSEGMAYVPEGEKFKEKPPARDYQS